MMQVPTTTVNTNYVFELLPNDVLFGRGSAPNDFEGNIRFRQLVAERKAEYMATSRRHTKGKVAREIINTIFAANGRFLTKAEIKGGTVDGVPQNVDAYILADEADILEKTKQALRQSRCSRAKKIERQLEEDELPELFTETKNDTDELFTPYPTERGDIVPVEEKISKKRRLGEPTGFQETQNLACASSLVADRSFLIPTIVRYHLCNSDANVVRESLMILSALCCDENNGVENVKYITRIGGPLAVILTMGRHICDVSIQSEGCNLLSNLACHAETQEILKEVGGVETVASAIREFPTDHNVQRHGHIALATMSFKTFKTGTAVRQVL